MNEDFDEVIRDVLPLFWSSVFVATNKSNPFSAEFTPDDVVIPLWPCFRGLSDEALFKSGANMVLRVSAIVQPTIIIPLCSKNESLDENETFFRSSVVVVNRIWR